MKKKDGNKFPATKRISEFIRYVTDYLYNIDSLSGLLQYSKDRKNANTYSLDGVFELDDGHSHKLISFFWKTTLRNSTEPDYSIGPYHINNEYIFFNRRGWKVGKDNTHMHDVNEFIYFVEKSYPRISICYSAEEDTLELIDDNNVNPTPPTINTFTQTTMNYSKYISLLKANYNLVLTGAPGTGKTFMAKEIAKEMNAEIMFVQFHPSYDYTDFVEGLRPVDNDGQMGFERKDGVFKEFCKKAISEGYDTQVADNAEDGYQEEPFSYDIAFENAWIQLKDDLIARELKQEEDPNYDCRLEIPLNPDQNIYVNLNNTRKGLADVHDSYTRYYNADQLLRVYKGLKGVNKGGHDNYRKAVVKFMMERYNLPEYRKAESTPNTIQLSNDINKKNYVVIIDEINRGEASKIFGELFYAIDPGYRGKTEIKVKTQYQNLVEDDDIFADGFYVPDNVYILATMNDIDRSVESMDFAMRRRFTWQEVSPSDTQDMLNTLGDQLATQAKAAMSRLNKKIENTEELGSAYMIGPSYFLKLKNDGYNLDVLWNLNIEPLLKEYLRGVRKAQDIIKGYKKAYFNDEQTESSSENVDENVVTNAD